MKKTEYQLSKWEMDEVFNRYKDDENIQRAQALGWEIYVRENGYLVLNPEVVLPKHKLNKIRKNYCLYI